MQHSHPGVRDITVHGLSQWDYGQILEIQSEDLPAIVEVHFASPGMTEAIVRPCNVVSGVGTVTIPDVCLEQIGPIKAWVFEIHDTQGATTKTITLPVAPRPKPSKGDTIPASFLDQYEELIAEVNEAVGKLQEGDVAVKKAQESVSAARATSARSLSTHAAPAQAIAAVAEFSETWDGDLMHLEPTADNCLDLGNEEKRFRTVYTHKLVTEELEGVEVSADHVKHAKEADSLIVSQPYLENVEEYEISEPGLYVVVSGSASTLYTDVISVPSWALDSGREIFGHHAKYVGHMPGIGTFNPYNNSGNIQFVFKIAREDYLPG